LPDRDDKSIFRLDAASGICCAKSIELNSNFTGSDFPVRWWAIDKILNWVGVNPFYVFDGKLEATFATYYT